MERLVKIKDKEYTINEVKYKDLIDGTNVSTDDTAAQAKRLMQLAVEITDDEYNDLSMKDGLELQKAINEVNGLADFQKPLKA